ncbi:hypothetical protein HELRODRAFT_64965, partial [Helobdella robusta]|uniref:Ionotropic glutamate receptor C-terminal domain-containing protein n=1 Tax=Helobdella robusta TaxID=6412 RepID=T1FY21_HELRO
RTFKYETALMLDSIKLVSSVLSDVSSSKVKRWLTSFQKFTTQFDCDREGVSAWEDGDDVMKHLMTTDFYGATGHVKFDDSSLRSDVKMDVMEVSNIRQLYRMGSWSSEGGISIHEYPPPRLREKMRFAPLTNRTRFITSILGAPYFMKRELSVEPEDPNDFYEGYCPELAQKIAKRIGFTYIIRPVKDGKFGATDDNVTWNGMIGELVRKEADMAIAPLTITSARERVVDFSKPFMSLGISIMIKKITKENPGIVGFMKPLSHEIWMCVSFAYIGVSVVLFLVARFSPGEKSSGSSRSGVDYFAIRVDDRITIFNSLWFSLGAFMQQGCDVEPKSLPGRIVGSVWWFFTLIIISSYTANLAAFLTQERMQSPIESADDLAKQTEIKYGSVDSGSTKDFFKTSSISVYERMWAFMSSNNPTVIFVKTNDEGVDRVRTSKGKYAFLAESTTVDYYNQRKPCDTMKVGGNLDSKGYGIGMQQGSDLKDRITLTVLELHEGGELTKLETKWWQEKGECPVKEVTLKKLTSSLKLQNTLGIFYILIAGLVLALILVVLEISYASKMESTRRRVHFLFLNCTGG